MKSGIIIDRTTVDALWHEFTHMDSLADIPVEILSIEFTTRSGRHKTSIEKIMKGHQERLGTVARYLHEALLLSDEIAIKKP